MTESAPDGACSSATSHDHDQVRPTAAGTTAFVLSGGANLGAAQVGMLRALDEAGVPWPEPFDDERRDRDVGQEQDADCSPILEADLGQAQGRGRPGRTDPPRGKALPCDRVTGAGRLHR